jgi:glutathione synthase/RimK-type ligase-like ATP-grasp enzyme
MNVGICFSKEFVGDTPLSHIGTKLPVYMRLLDLAREEGWEAFVLTRKTYKGDGIFDGVWKYDGKTFQKIESSTKIDLVYDRSAGVGFPPEGDESVVWVNRRDFKVLAWDKWAAHQVIGEYMPQTIILENENDIPEVVNKIKSDWVVLKPFNGLKGIGIYIGPKKDAVSFHFSENYKKYIGQEFVDTSNGISNITPGKHDLRVAIVNGEAVWCHVRVPAEGTFLANAAQGGNLTEVDYQEVPGSIKKIVEIVSEKFNKDYDNPIFSLDFGIGKDSKPYIFEINDQIGFPKWEMKNRDKFLNALIANFRDKLK